ncbi:MarR family winged helix-turn-helix transcriptional regulator [Streptomyces sp. NPDC005538]|uniref:MarR family winged helix-turn-helix transcriptional regulator n=1 Tax=unclassified Streptomyces TaxID=2593676 RepID=UPI0033B27435
MPVHPAPLPVIDRPDAASADVGLVPVDGPRSQQETAELIVGHWTESEWPAELLSRNCYTSTDGTSVLTYEQWSTEEPPPVSRPSIDGYTVRPFRLHQVVRGSGIKGPIPVPQCFPGAFFTMPDHEAARRWIKSLLTAEEVREGVERAYDGGIAANFHISLDGTTVLIFSEWETEQHALDHMSDVILPILGDVGESDGGARYRHHLSLRREFTDDELIAQPVGYWTLAAREVIAGHINARLGELGVAQPHWWTLYRLGEVEEGLTGERLNALMRHTRPYVDTADTIEPAVEDLLASGHVSVTDDERLRLTASGQELRARLLELLPHVRDEIHEGIDDKDYLTTVRVLRRMIGNLGGNADFH